jgi:hypothetical protein
MEEQQNQLIKMMESSNQRLQNIEKAIRECRKNKQVTGAQGDTQPTPARLPPRATFASIAASGTAQATTPKATPTPEGKYSCTIDVSGVPEALREKATAEHLLEAFKAEAGKTPGNTWKAQISRDYRISSRWRITCKTAKELETARKQIKNSLPEGARLLGAQFYPIRIDAAPKQAIIDEEGNIRQGAIQRLGEANGVTVAKLSWLSKKSKTGDMARRLPYSPRWKMLRGS